MPSAERILLAITSHGLGHLTRSLAIARALRERHPRVEWVIATTVPRARIALDLPPPFEHRPVAYEPGTAHKSCFELDVEATRAAYVAYLADREARLAEEVRFLREAGCAAVVSDIPALPLRAAAVLGLPRLGIANFTWDWILEPLLAGGAAEAALELLREDYAHGDLHLRLPFGPEASPFPRSEPAPLVSRRARLDAAEVRQRLALPPPGEESLVLVCPGGWEPEAWPRVRVSGCEGLRFVTVGDLPVAFDAPALSLPHALPHGISFPDLVLAADVVLAKPGYGIASECAAHRTPLVSIERPEFRETDVLLSDWTRLGGPRLELSLLDFFAGAWEPVLREALAACPAWSEIPEDGAARVAVRVAEGLGLSAPTAP